MLAGWFDTERSQQFIAIHHLKFIGTIAGKAVRNRRTAFSNDLRGDKIINCDHPFFDELGITRTLAVPIRYPSGRLGAINLYRRKSELRFKKSDGALLGKAAKLVPLLYKAVRERAAFELLKETGDILRHYLRPIDETKATARQTRTLKDLCEAIQKMFHAVEVSIFLEADNRPGTFTCAYTNPGPHAPLVLNLEYKASFNDGFSGLALQTGEPRRIYDTQECEEQMKEIQSDHPEFTRQGRGRSKAVNAALGVPEGWKPPPHSFMVVPLLSGQKTLGLLRCWIAKDGPPFFSTEDLDLLQLVGEQFAHTVETWHQYRRGALEREAWAKLGKNIGRRRDSKSGLARPDDPYLQGLELVEMCIPDADISTIRLRDPAKNDLYFHAYLYQRSANLTAEHMNKVIKTRFDLNSEEPQSLAAIVLKRRKGLLIDNVTGKSLYTERFPGVKKMIVAPIFHGKEAVGVLDVRSCEAEPFPPYALSLAEAVGRLLGVYAERSKAQRDASRFRGAAAKAQMDKADIEQKNKAALEDIHHQMKGPLAEAVRRVSDLLQNLPRAPLSFTLSSDLIAIRSTLHRSSLMSKVIGLLATLDSGQQLPLHKTSLAGKVMERLALEISDNNRVRISETRNIRIFCDSDSFYRYTPIDLHADTGLIAQALNNLVDNAVKYSYPNTTIRVFGGRTGKTNNFYVAVTNVGIGVRPEEAPLCAHRNWRSEKAKASAGEGNGIGLWIVDHIMRAHGGRLEVIPTRKRDDVTEVRLVFSSD